MDSLKVTIEGKEYALPPFPVNQARQVYPLLDKARDNITTEDIDALCNMVRDALIKGGATVEEVDAMFNVIGINDVANLASQLVFGGSYLKK